MRVRDRGGHVLQTKQVDPAALGNDDWKAGVYAATGVASLQAVQRRAAGHRASAGSR